MTMPSVIHESWHPYLEPLFEGNQVLQNLLQNILPKTKYFPTYDNIFRAFSIPLQDIKVVIIGQDPYPNPNQANGYAFAVNEGQNFPPSLRVIGSEIIDEFQNDNDMFLNILAINENPQWSTLQHWVDQGVMLLNTGLTVEAYKVGSHIQHWQFFIWSVVGIISKQVSPIWMLWGKKAQELESLIRRSENSYGSNIILTAAHPAAELYARNGKAGFYGCNHFVVANSLLAKANKTIIKW